MDCIANQSEKPAGIAHRWCNQRRKNDLLYAFALSASFGFFHVDHSLTAPYTAGVLRVLPGANITKWSEMNR